MKVDYRAIARVYIDLVNALRREEDSIPQEIRKEYNDLKAEFKGETLNRLFNLKINYN